MTPAFALRKRPDAAFEALYQRHVHEIYRYALAVLGNPADAEDVTQTTFMNAYRAFNAGERPRKPQNWLRAIAHNVCRQRFRQAARRPSELQVLDDLPGVAAPDEPEGPSANDIARALRSLPFNQRAALVMRELEGRRQAEIAAELELSESAVEALLFRARRAMREQLESSVTCGEAARAISRQLERSLPREERGALRAHLRECPDCASFARQARAQRGAFKKLGAIPIPASLLTWSGGGSAVGVAGAGIGAKVAAGVAAAVVLAGAGDVAIHNLPGKSPQRPRAAAPREPVQARAAAKPIAAHPVRLHTRTTTKAAHHRKPQVRHGATPVGRAHAKKHGRPASAPAKPAKPVKARPHAVRSHGRAAKPHPVHARPPKPAPGRALGHGHAAKPPNPHKPPPRH